MTIRYSVPVSNDAGAKSHRLVTVTSWSDRCAAMAAQAPDLAGVQFAVFGMGDSEYPETFNFGGKRLEEMMLAAGATLLGARVTHDASGDDMADDLAYPWAEAVIALAEPALA